MATSLDLAPAVARAPARPARRSDTSPSRAIEPATQLDRALSAARPARHRFDRRAAGPAQRRRLVPRGGVLRALASVALAVAASLAIASAEAALWKRCRGSQDVLFADLMLWGWVRRYRSERRLARTRALYDVATRAAPAVSIDLLTTLSDLLEARDAYTHGHSQRVARHAERIARTMHLQADEVAKIRTAASVHDVGKLHTPRQILNNPRRLTQGEFEVMKRHAADGADMLASGRRPRHSRHRAPPSRAHRRQRLSRRPGRERDPARLAHHRGRRHVRLDHLKSRLPASEHAEEGPRRALPGEPISSSTPRLSRPSPSATARDVRSRASRSLRP